MREALEKGVPIEEIMDSITVLLDIDHAPYPYAMGREQKRWFLKAALIGS